MAVALLYSEAQQRLPELVCSELTVNKRGGKCVHIYLSATERFNPKVQLCKDGDPKLRAPFGLTVYDDAAASTRQNLDFSIDFDPLRSFFAALDERVVDLAHSKAVEWFRRSLSREEVASMYKPTLTTNDRGYPPTVRTKANVVGSNAVRVWACRSDGSGRREGSTEDIQRGTTYWANITIGPVWFLAKQFGVGLTCTELLAFASPSSELFPFQTAREPSDTEEERHDPTPEQCATSTIKESGEPS